MKLNKKGNSFVKHRIWNTLQNSENTITELHRCKRGNFTHYDCKFLEKKNAKIKEGMNESDYAK